MQNNDDIIWLVVSTILKNMKVNRKDYPIYCGKNVWNHQQDDDIMNHDDE